MNFEEENYFYYSKWRKPNLFKEPIWIPPLTYF